MCTGTFKNLNAICPQPAGTASVFSGPGPSSGTSSALCAKPSEPHQPSAPEPSGTSSASCAGTFRNLISHLPLNRLANEPSGTSSIFCAGTLWNLIGYLRRNLQNLVCYLRRNRPELHPPSGPQHARTLFAICAGTIQNLISHLRRKRPELCLLFVPEPSGISSALFLPPVSCSYRPL